MNLVLEDPDLRHLSHRLYLQGVFQDPVKEGNSIRIMARLGRKVFILCSVTLPVSFLTVQINNSGTEGESNPKYL